MCISSGPKLRYATRTKHVPHVYYVWTYITVLKPESVLYEYPLWTQIAICNKNQVRTLCVPSLDPNLRYATKIQSQSVI